jgi:ATP-dependent Clp protease ATP-binding subunit ClpX
MNTEAIAAAVHSHGGGRRIVHASDGNKHVLLLVGTSRSRAVLLARVLAHIFDAPFACGQAMNWAATSSATETSAPIFISLLQAADFDVELAQRGVVFLDGIDVSDAQEMLVRLLEEKRFAVVAPSVQIDIASILFVCRGDFAGLDERMVRRGKHPEQPITKEDLLALGVRPEFMRRVGAILRISPLEEETVVRLVCSADLKRWPTDPNI